MALLESIKGQLAERGFEVLIDFDRLGPGALWRDEIYTWLGVCHAGVIVISPDSLTAASVWVPRESAILSWRKVLDPTFTLLPILLPGVTLDDLRADPRFRDIGFVDLNVIQHTDVEHTCQEIVAGLSHLRAVSRTPLEELAEQIEVLLRGVDSECLDEAVHRCRTDCTRLTTLGSEAHSLALALLQTPLSDALAALEYLATRTQSPGAVDRILEIIAPSWVDLSAARWIAVCAKLVDRRPGAVINAETRFAAEMYVRRATCLPPKTMWRVVPITAVCGEIAFEDLATEIQAALLTELQPNLLADDFGADPDSQLTALLQKLNSLGRPVVIVMRLPGDAAELVPKLQERFPFLIFLFLSGKELPDAAGWPETLLRRVEPKLLAGRESSARTDYEAARTLLRPGD